MVDPSPSRVVADSRLQPAQRFAVAAGIVYLVFGIVGLAATGLSDFASVGGHQLLVFGLDPLQNVLHLGAGASWLWASKQHHNARRINLILGLIFLVLAGLGFGGLAEFLALEPADSGNFLHLATAALSLYFGTVGSASIA